MKHLNASGRWPSGNVRFYYRPKGQKGRQLPDLPPEHPDFLAAYAALARAEPPPRPGRAQPGTIATAVASYMRSQDWAALAPKTRSTRSPILADLAGRYGEARFADLRPRHVRADLAPFAPHAANQRHRVWRALCAWLVATGRLEADPSREVRRKKAPPSDGFTPWTRDDVARFRARWPVGSRERLAMELMHRSCASVADACRLGPGMVRDGWLSYRRGKSGSTAVVPWGGFAPAWFEDDGWLWQCLEGQPRQMTYIVTAHGAARSAKAAAQWFSAACRAAGLEGGKAAHGLRKHRAAVFRENGASEEQRMAVLGQESPEVARGYSRAADLVKVVSGTTSSNGPPPEFQHGRKST